MPRTSVVDTCELVLLVERVQRRERVLPPPHDERPGEGEEPEDHQGESERPGPAGCRPCGARPVSEVRDNETAPSTRSTWPVRNDASSLTRKRNVFAMSSGWPFRRTGTRAAKSRTPSGPSELTGSRLWGVSITPGAIAFAVIPCGPSSTASVRTRPTIPAFAVV